MDNYGNPVEGQPPVPDGDSLLAILKTCPRECSEEEKTAFFLLVNLFLSILNSNFGNKTHRDLMWQKCTPSDITWCLCSFHCQATADVPVGEIRAAEGAPMDEIQANQTVPQSQWISFFVHRHCCLAVAMSPLAMTSLGNTTIALEETP